MSSVRFQQLSGMDAGFLYMETPTLHMHTLKVAVVRPRSADNPATFASFRGVLERRLSSLPSFRLRLMEIPFGFGHPVWVVDDKFDLSRHLAYRKAVEPGGRQELNAIVSEIASTPLPRDRPLWAITMVDGLEGGRSAFVCKLHHSLADGSAAMAMLIEVLTQPDRRAVSDQPGGNRPAEDGMDAQHQRAPNKREILLWAIGQGLRRTASLPGLLLRTFRGLFSLVKRNLSGPHPALPAPFTGPRTHWSGSLSARRSFGTRAVSLEDMKRVKEELGVTLNDVVLGICGGALRAHLQEVEGAVPEKPLLASVPINTHPELAQRTRGNHVGHLTASLCTHIADPIERIRAIHEMMDEAKQRQLALGSDLLERWFEFTPPDPYTAAVRFWSKRRMADLVPSPISLVVSNVRGPASSLVIAGTTLEALYSVGPILEGVGLNITGWSYAGQVFFVGLACPDQIADIQSLVDRLPEALAEVLRACRSPRASLASESDGPSTNGSTSDRDAARDGTEPRNLPVEALG
jgi:diacylglycerol O-acyltransferase